MRALGKQVFLVMLALWIYSTPVHADPGALTFSARHDSSILERLPYTALGIRFSEPGATMDAFAIELQPILWAFAARTHEEPCGEIAVGGGRFGIVLGSNDSHLACAIDADRVPPGMHATGVTIHAHGGAGSFYMNRADMVFSGIRTDGTQPWIRVAGENVEHFSPTDFAGGPGYLATPTGVIFQNGSDAVRSLVQKAPRLTAGPTP